MNGETVCYDCLQTLPKTLLEAWREIASLRAKIEQMERQEPVAWQRLYKDGSGSEDFTDLPDVFERQRSLYALPGAQPEPSEQDESVRKAWSRFSNELHRSPDAPYPGMSEAFEQHFSQSFTDRDWRVESGVWAAAWKAAKRHGAKPAPSVPRESIERMLTQLMDLAVSNGANSISMPDEYVEVAAWLCGIPAQPAPSVPDGWLRAIDEALVTAHIGVANAHDTYEQAKAKLDNLIGFHVDVATDPAVNGGWKLVQIEPTEDMLRAMTDPFIAINGDNRKAFEIAYTAMLAAAPEAKP